MILFHLFGEFFYVGLFSIGGGMATIPFLFDMGARTGWFTSADLANMIAVSEATPGPIGINMATYVGYTTAGPVGSIVAPLGLTAPAFLSIIIIARLLLRVRDNPNVNAVFRGLRPAAVGLIASAFLSVCTTSLFSLNGGSITFSWKSILVFAIVFLCFRLPWIRKLSPLVFILLSAVAGILFHMAG